VFVTALKKSRREHVVSIRYIYSLRVKEVKKTFSAVHVGFSSLKKSILLPENIFFLLSKSRKIKPKIFICLPKKVEKENSATWKNKLRQV